MTGNGQASESSFVRDVHCEPHGMSLLAAQRRSTLNPWARRLLHFTRHGMDKQGVPAFTIVEAVISTAIVAVMFVAALNTVGVSRLTQQRAALTSRGQLFAEMLLSEILQQNYKDSGANPVFGAETGEATVTRADFDDADDYNAWSGIPTAKDGTSLANSAGWMQSVTVQWVDRLDPSLVQAAETNTKRITVTTKFNNIPQVTLVAIKTAGQ